MRVHRVKVIHDGGFYVGDWPGAEPALNLLDVVTGAKRHFARLCGSDSIDVSIDATLVTQDVQNGNRDAEAE